MGKATTKKTCGGARIVRVNAGARSTEGGLPAVLNLILPISEVFWLRAALDDVIARANRVKRSSLAGARLAVFLDRKTSRVNVLPHVLREEDA